MSCEDVAPVAVVEQLWKLHRIPPLLLWGTRNRSWSAHFRSLHFQQLHSTYARCESSGSRQAVQCCPLLKGVCEHLAQTFWGTWTLAASRSSAGAPCCDLVLIFAACFSAVSHLQLIHVSKTCYRRNLACATNTCSHKQWAALYKQHQYKREHLNQMLICTQVQTVAWRLADACGVGPMFFRKVSCLFISIQKARTLAV